MAEIIRTKNHLATAIRRKRWQSTLAVLTIVIGLGLIGWHHVLIGLVLFGAGALSFRRLLNASRILAAGLVGERHTQSVFEQLPDDFSVLSDLDVPAEGHSSQIDHIIVGPPGVFVVETKNVHGVIRGNLANQRLSQHKQTAGGRSYDKTLYNPVKQVGTHVYRVAAYLKQHRIQTWVQGVVYFSDAATELELTGDARIPVFSHKDNGPGKMLKYIQDRPGKTLSKRDRVRTVECLKRCVTGTKR